MQLVFGSRDAISNFKSQANWKYIKDGKQNMILLEQSKRKQEKNKT
jgi:hypothetical protein